MLGKIIRLQQKNGTVWETGMAWQNPKGREEEPRRIVECMVFAILDIGPKTSVVIEHQEESDEADGSQPTEEKEEITVQEQSFNGSDAFCVLGKPLQDSSWQAQQAACAAIIPYASVASIEYVMNSAQLKELVEKFLDEDQQKEIAESVGAASPAASIPGKIVDASIVGPLLTITKRRP